MFSVLQRGQVLFQRLPRRVVGARVAEAFVDPGLELLVGRGLVDGEGHRAGDRLDGLSSVDGPRLKFVRHTCLREMGWKSKMGPSRKSFSRDTVQRMCGV